MMYPFIQLSDETEIVHSDILPNGEIKVYIEKPDKKDCFHHATCFLPKYRWEDIYGFTSDEIDEYQETIALFSHLIFDFAQSDFDDLV